MTNTSELEDDDALGFALRAFVDELRGKGANAETIIYLMACDMFRTASSVLPNHARVLSILAKAASDLRRPLVAPDRVGVDE